MSVTAAIAQLTQVEVPDAIEPLHLRYARFALNEFLRATELCRRQYSLRLGSNNGAVLLPIAQGLTCIALKRVEFEGKALRTTGANKNVWLEGGSLFTDPPLDGVLSVDIVVSNNPLDGDMDVEELEQWVEVLCAGTLTRLYAMGSYPWANAQMAAYNRAVFDEGIEKARIAGKKLRDAPLSVVAYGGI